MIVTSVTSYINPHKSSYIQLYNPPMFWWFFIQTWPPSRFRRPRPLPFEALGMVEAEECIELLENGEKSEDSESSEEGACRGPVTSIFFGGWSSIYESRFILIHIYIYTYHISYIHNVYIYICINLDVYIHISYIHNIYIYIHAQIRTFAWSLCFSGKTTRVFNRPPRSRGRVLGVNFWFSRILGFLAESGRFAPLVLCIR